MAAGEPLAGSSAVASIWIALEASHPWAGKPLKTKTLSEIARRQLSLWDERPDTRVQLLQRPTERPTGRRTLLIASAVVGAEWCLRFDLDDDRELESIDLEELVAARAHPRANEVREPVFLVCTHGKRDRCCAKWGMPIYSAMAASGDAEVWQTSHLGGHRFAPTLVVLPHGYCYGRLRVSDCEPLMAAHRQGHVYEPDYLRGRSSHPPEVQAAEIALRKARGERSVAALSVVDVAEAEPGTHRVRFCLGDENVEITVAQSLVAQRRASCKDDVDSPGVVYVPR
jgi:hypothetical protein